MKKIVLLVLRSYSVMGKLQTPPPLTELLLSASV